ncbi:unnamed protein product [Staurois parvus]|uniref:Uncharacterized protein n=1 Tax=Staurois parvus TaxID=386267 RepID=A0ABN9GET2_9NEOB|nr:unnamed protein product [Staurois parvus]
MLLPVPESLMGPVRPPIAAVLHRHTCMCHFQVSSHHCWECGEFFDIGCWQITGLL